MIHRLTATFVACFHAPSSAFNEEPRHRSGLVRISHDRTMRDDSFMSSSGIVYQPRDRPLKGKQHGQH